MNTNAFFYFVKSDNQCKKNPPTKCQKTGSVSLIFPSANSLQGAATDPAFICNVGRLFHGFFACILNSLIALKHDLPLRVNFFGALTLCTETSAVLADPTRQPRESLRLAHHLPLNRLPSF